VEAYEKTLNEVAPLRVVKYKEDQIISTKVAALQKRRDRYLKKFKKTNDVSYLDKAKSFTYTLKKAVKKEARRIFQCKSRSPNPKHFWEALNEKMGKFRSPVTVLEIDGAPVTDPIELANHFGKFFQGKVVKLSISPVIPLNLVKPIKPIEFTLSEIDSAIKSMSNKKSFGVDGVPQNLFKDTAVLFPNALQGVLNSFSKFGIPDDLRIARVTPLHKKGSKLDINNYRPISNLSVFSKAYEKCLLARLNSELPGAEGEHQHGFRKGHSTETALLTIQSEIAKILDQGREGVIYSIDLSAAFDLLKPDKFIELYKDKLSEGLLFALGDFLTGRKFCINDRSANVMELDRGCVQGSILGPKLFSLYVAGLKDNLVSDDISLISYADDSYVIVAPKETCSIHALAELTIEKHASYLRSVGMIVNESKTEVMWIGANCPISHVTIGGNPVPLVNSMKALGVHIDGNLDWNKQAEHAVSKSKKLLSAFKFLRKYMTESQFLKAASANFYGSIFYASSVWFQNIKQIYKTKLTSTHFRMLRVAKKDFKMALKRTELTELCKRATPEQWAKFITATRVIKTVRSQEPPMLADRLMTVCFEEQRKPGLGLFYDSSRTRKGRQSIENRLLFMRSITFPWNLCSKLSDDRLRIEMKKVFFPYFSNEIHKVYPNEQIDEVPAEPINLDSLHFDLIDDALAEPFTTIL